MPSRSENDSASRPGASSAPQFNKSFARSATFRSALTPTQRLIYLALVEYANKFGQCWPGYPRLAHDTGFNEGTIQRCIKQLGEVRCLDVSQRHMREGPSWERTNVYTLSYPKIDAAREAESLPRTRIFGSEESTPDDLAQAGADVGDPPTQEHEAPPTTTSPELATTEVVAVIRDEYCRARERQHKIGEYTGPAPDWGPLVRWAMALASEHRRPDESLRDALRRAVALAFGIWMRMVGRENRLDEEKHPLCWLRYDLDKLTGAVRALKPRVEKPRSEQPQRQAMSFADFKKLEGVAA